MWPTSSRALWARLVLVVVLAGCDKDSPTQPSLPEPCSYSVSATSLAFVASGGPGAVTVTTAANCPWTATSDRAWMSVTSGASSTGNGTVNLDLTANTDTAERTGTLTVAGQSVAVRQDGLEACTLDISPSSVSFNKDAATGSFAVSAPGHCQWHASSNAAWLAVTAGQGTGHGTVSYRIERNRTATDRTGAIAVAHRTFVVTQSGDPGICDYSVSPVQFSPCMSTPFELTAAVTTQSGCTWTASPGASWISVTGGQSGTGPGTVTFTVADNWDTPRQSAVMVRWPTATAGQNVQVIQAGCRYAVSVNAIGVAASGGPGRFEVIQSSEPIACGGPLQNACLWIAEPNVPWITVTTSMPQVGDNPVSFTVSPNASTTARTGRIRVRDKVVTITQAGI